jgi:uncharacterized membrane-anchored protein YjiN (DUF445 family)
LLAVVAVIFVLATLWRDHGAWTGYVQATAEAGLVGGLADWFAVTALFRRPLGVPIPHTAVVVERKAQFAETLGEFIQESFLTPDTIVERTRAAAVVPRLAAWLDNATNAGKVAGYVVDGAVAVADAVKDDDVHRALEQLLRERLDTVALAPLAGRALRVATADGRHGELLDSMLRGLDRYLEQHRDDLRSRVGQRSPWWLPGAVEDRIFERLIDGARVVVAEMVAHPEHHLRREIDLRLARLAHDLETSPDLRARGEQFKHDILSQEQLREWVASLWSELKDDLRRQAAAPDSELRARIAGAVCGAGQRLQRDTVLAARAQDALEAVARSLAEHFHGEIAALVTATIDRWDAEETARRLELLLGPDLQYIRINGTVVGGLAGLGLYTFAQALH